MNEERRFQEMADNFLKDSKVKQMRMFGSPGLRFKGKVFTFLWKGQLVLKLPAQRVQQLLASSEAKLFDPGHGRVSIEWVAVGSGLKSDWAGLAREAKEFVGKASSGKRTQQSRSKLSARKQRT